MLIGLGGGAASIMDTGANAENLDFDSVQRGNPEMQRRAQEVIDRCWQMGDDNPILSIHDVGAGGISNALPELVHGGGGARVSSCARCPAKSRGMSPMQIWCNEAQERYVLAIAPERLAGVQAAVRARALPVRGAGRGHDGTTSWSCDDAQFGNNAGGHAARRAARQAAAACTRKVKRVTVQAACRSTPPASI